MFSCSILSLFVVIALSGQFIVFTCAVNCVSVNPPTNGFASTCADGNSCPVGTKVTFTCSTGYQILGPEHISCQNLNLIGQNFGTWSGLTPLCVLDSDHCPQLSEVTNGNVTDCFTRACPFGTEVKFSCNEGFILKGAAAMMCQKPNNKSQSIWSSFQSYCSQPGYFSLDEILYSIFGNAF